MDNLQYIILEKLNKCIAPLDIQIIKCAINTWVYDTDKFVVKYVNSFRLLYPYSKIKTYIKAHKSPIYWNNINDIFLSNKNSETLICLCKRLIEEKHQSLVAFLDRPVEHRLIEMYSYINFLENVNSLEEIKIKMDLAGI